MTTATTLGLAEPAVAAVLGLTVLGERLTITGLAGPGFSPSAWSSRGLARAAPHGRGHI